MRPTKWTETVIKQAFDEFVKQYDRLPTKQEMYEKYKGEFPRPLSVKITTGKTMGEYLYENYNIYFNKCQSKIYGDKPKEYWIEDFKNQYIKYKKPTEYQYNKLRIPGTPNTQTLAKIIGVVTWAEVLTYCGLKEDSNIKLCGGVEFEETLENYQKLNNKLQEILLQIK